MGLVALVLAAAVAPAADPPARVPQPKSLSFHDGAMPLSSANRLVYRGRDQEPLARLLAHDIEVAVGLRMAAANVRPMSGDIEIIIDPSFTGEASMLEVGDTATIRAGNPCALAFATTTLLQLLREQNGVVSLPRIVASGYQAVNATWTPLYIVRGNRKQPEFLFN